VRRGQIESACEFVVSTARTRSVERRVKQQLELRLQSAPRAKPQRQRGG